MNALVPSMMLTPAQVELARRTVAKDLEPSEFDLFMYMANRMRLDPLRKQIYAFVQEYKDKRSKEKVRKLSFITGIDGYRSIADRTGNYRPGETNVVCDETAKDPDSNPYGIVYADVTVYKFSHGAWHANTERAYWDEYAPVKEYPEGGWQWKETGDFYPDDHDERPGQPIKTKKPIGRIIRKLEKDTWRKTGRVMIAKCAEARAIRRAWPDDFSGTYIEEELDKSQVLDLTATEIADQAAEDARMQRIGGDQILIDWMDGKPLIGVHVGDFGDRVIEWVHQHKGAAGEIAAFRDKNAMSFNLYWAKDKDGALAVKKEIETAIAKVLATPA